VLFDLKEFDSRFEYFRRVDYKTYPYCFGEFWKRKLKIEESGENILSNVHLKTTYTNLSQILKIWLWHRPYSFSKLAGRLLASLEALQDSYNYLRNYSLLEFDKIPEKLLKFIWHEIGCVKAFEKNTSGYYPIMATTKLLMFLWGQTLAFDSVVRKRIPKFGISGLTKDRWAFDTWKRIMEEFQASLQQQSRIVDHFRELSLNEYGTDAIVPYGQLLDLYYWVPNARA